MTQTAYNSRPLRVRPKTTKSKTVAYRRGGPKKDSAPKKGNSTRKKKDAASEVKAGIRQEIAGKADPKRRPMPQEDVDRLHELRTLESYPTNYVNPRFPVLSFIYALYAGHENALYCDFTEEYVEKYLTGDTGRRAAEIFGELEPHRFDEPPPKPNAEQWTQVLALVYEELTQPDLPTPFW